MKGAKGWISSPKTRPILVVVMLLLIALTYTIFYIRAIDFVAYCEYTEDVVVYSHRDLCPPHWGGQALVSWDVDFREAPWGTIWSEYLAPYSSGSPYNMEGDSIKPKVLVLVEQFVYHVTH